MGVRELTGSITALRAWALYDQGRFDEAAQMVQGPLDLSSYAAVAALTNAKLLARRGQFATARRLADEQEALLPPTASPLARAITYEGSGEVQRLAGAPGQATSRLRAAMENNEDRRPPRWPSESAPPWLYSPTSLEATRLRQSARWAPRARTRLPVLAAKAPR